MSAGTAPIFVATPKNWFASTGTAANTNIDGTGTVVTLMTAGANGSRISKVRLWHMGTNVATVVRLFVNNGSANTTPANNGLVYEYTMAANSVSQTAQSVPGEINLDLSLAAGNKILVTIGTAVAAGIMVNADGGDY